MAPLLPTPPLPGLDLVSVLLPPFLFLSLPTPTTSYGTGNPIVTAVACAGPLTFCGGSQAALDGPLLFARAVKHAALSECLNGGTEAQ